MRLVLEAVCKDAKIEATDAEVDAKVAELAESYGRKVEELKNNDDLMGHIKQNVVSEKAIALIVDNARVKVVDAPEVKLEKKATKKTTAKKAEDGEEKAEKKTTTKKSTKKAE
jgi:trigger factor